jgi:hypothetical protein
MFLAGSQSFACQCLFIALLHLDIASLQLQRPGEGTAGSHAGEVLGSVNCEDVAQDLGKYGREASNMEVHRINAHKDESESVFAVCTAREVGKAEKASLGIMLVLCYGGRSYELAHESSRCSSVGLYECCLFIRPLCVPECAMHHVERVT